MSIKDTICRLLGIGKKKSATLFDFQHLDTSLFDPYKTYPSDETGAYTELEGEVIEIEDALMYSRPIKVKTDKGVFIGFTSDGLKYPPQVGDIARIRLYRSGGGWYPDDKIVGWRRK